MKWIYIPAMVTLLAAPALSAECGPLISYGTVPLKHFDGEASDFVPVEIAGVPKLMLLDTGADFTTMTSAVAQELSLSANRSDFQLYDVTGARASSAVIASIKIGTLRGDKIHFMLSPASTDFRDTRVAGLLGADILRNFDVAIDFGAHTFTLHDQKHCEGQVVYWPERPIAEIPIKLQRGYGILLTVTLDGKEVKAQLDTGASTSTLEKNKAEGAFGLTLGAADTPVVGNLNGTEGLTTWKHQFKSLTLAGIEVANPEIHIIPDKMSEQMSNWSTGSLLDKQAHETKEPPMLLGMNVLKHLHIYIAYKEKKLYITPASQPASPAQ